MNSFSKVKKCAVCKCNSFSFNCYQLRTDHIYDQGGEIGSSLKLLTAGEVKVYRNRLLHFLFLLNEAFVSVPELTLFFSVLSRPLETTPLSS